VLSEHNCIDLDSAPRPSLNLETSFLGIMADSQVKYHLYLFILKLMLTDFGLVLTFVKLAGTLNELYCVLIFSYTILLTVLHRVEAKEISFQDQCDSLCIYNATSKGRKKNVITITMCSSCITTIIEL